MHRLLRIAAQVAVLCALVGGAGSRSGGLARADDAEARHARAIDLFEKSEVAYDSGRFADAVALLRQSYALKKEPVLLYNLGRAYEALGDRTSAADAYEAFLQAQPTAQDRAGLERRIATLRREVAEREALRKQALERERSRPVRSPSAVPWIVAGVGAASLAGGGVLRILANQRNDDAKREPTYLEADSLHSQAQTFATISAICFIAGGAVLAGGLLWGTLDLSAAKRSQGTGAADFGVLAF